MRKQHLVVAMLHAWFECGDATAVTCKGLQALYPSNLQSEVPNIIIMPPELRLFRAGGHLVRRRIAGNLTTRTISTNSAIAKGLRTDDSTSSKPRRQKNTEPTRGREPASRKGYDPDRTHAIKPDSGSSYLGRDPRAKPRGPESAERSSRRQSSVDENYKPRGFAAGTERAARSGTRVQDGQKLVRRTSRSQDQVSETGGHAVAAPVVRRSTDVPLTEVEKFMGTYPKQRPWCLYSSDLFIA